MHHPCSSTPGPLAGGLHRAWGTVSLMAALTVLSTGALCGANGPRVLIYDRESQMNAGDVLLRLCCCASHRRLRVCLASIWRRGAGGRDVQLSPPPPAFKDTGEVVFSRFGSWKVCGKFLLKRPLLTQLREPLARRRDPGCALPLRWMTLKQNQLNWRRTQSLSFMCQGEKLLLHPALIGRVGSQLPGNHPAVYGASLTDSC